jgi:hypothetical protein
MSRDSWDIAIQAASKGITVIADVENVMVDTSGLQLPAMERIEKFSVMSGTVERITSILEPTFKLPEGALGTVKKEQNGYAVHLIADKPGGSFVGTFEYKGKSIEIPCRSEPFIALLPEK